MFMKKKLILISIIIFTITIFADFQRASSKNKISKKTDLNSKKDRDLIEGFEWEEMSSAWTIIDEDGDGLGWAWSSFEPLNGNKHMVCDYNQAGNNDWLISPQLTLSADTELKFWASSYDEYPESYNVLVSETGIAIEDFTILDTVIDAPSVYTENIIDLSAYDGKEIYIAIQSISIDKYYLFIDDFSVSNCTWTPPADNYAPEFVALNSYKTIVGSDLDLKLFVTDATGVPPTIEASYELNESTETIIMDLVSDRLKYCYTGTISALQEEAVFAITFHLTDTHNPANTTNLTKTISFIEPYETDTFNEDFETFTNFGLDPLPWIFIDNDGISTYGFQEIDFPNQFYTGSFITLNPYETAPALTGEDIYIPHSGNKYMSCFDAIAGPNDDWMISPKILMNANLKLEFWAKSICDDYGLERFRVNISTTGVNLSDFTVISDELNSNGTDYVEAPTEWTKYSFDLSEYGNEEYIYVAINCISADAFLFMIDDISVGSNTGIDDSYELEAANYDLKQNYPNPFNPITKINYELTIANYKKAEIVVYNVMGEEVWSSKPLSLNSNYCTFNGSSFNSGIYYYSLVVDGKKMDTKAMILIK